MGYIYSIVAVVAFTVLGASYKVSDRRKCDGAQVNFFLLVSAAVIVLAWGLAVGIKSLPGNVVTLGVIDGVLVFGSILVFRRAAALGRISTSWTIINLSLILPVLVSVLFWHEMPSLRHYAGFAMTVLAVVLLGMDAARAGE